MKPVTLKVLLIGDSGVGKSCIMTRFCFEKFSDTFMNTIGVDFGMKMVHVGQDTCKIQLWDTAGQERYRGITTSYFRGAHAILVVFDVNNSRSLDNIPSWLAEIDAHATGPREWGDKKPLLFLVGNKIDSLPGQLNMEGLQKYANDLKMQRFFPTSAKTAEGVADAFHAIAQSIMRMNAQYKPRSSFNDSITVGEDSRSMSCCGRGTNTVASKPPHSSCHNRAPSSYNQPSKPSSKANGKNDKGLSSPLAPQITDRPFLRLADSSIAAVSTSGAQTGQVYTLTPNS